MKLIDKILVGIDFNTASQKALNQAISLARQFNSEIILTHIIPEMDMTNLSEDMVRDVVNKELETLEEKLRAEKVQYKTMVDKGVPFIRIMEIAELQNVNVIMIGAGNDENNKMGLNAEKLMHKSIKPVWVVSDNSNGAFKNILCPVDFSVTSERALENAVHLSRQFDADLNILHIIEPDLTGIIYEKLGLSVKSEEERTARLKQLDSMLSKFDFSGIRYNKIIVEGSPGEEIIKQVKNNDIGLLLMGSVGHTAHPKMLTGSTARKVFSELPTATISFKSENIIQLKLDSELNDIHSRFQQGIKLLDNGFVPQAIAYFNYCLHEDPLFAPAWELLADAHFRLGQDEKALQFKSRAEEIRNKLWAQQVEADIKNRHALYKSRS